MVDVLRPLSKADIKSTVAQSKPTMHILPSFASPWEIEKREQDEAILAQLNAKRDAFDQNTGRLLEGILNERAQAGVVKPLTVVERFKGVSSPVGDDWAEFAAEPQDVKDQIVAGWQNLEQALA